MPLPEGYKHSEVTKQKMSNTRKGHKTSSETKRKISKAMKGRVFSEETKKKMSQSAKGHIRHWKGGQYQRLDGRIFIKIHGHPNAHNNYVMQSRLVMEKSLGRYLKPCEVVHHINKIKSDDRPENLQLFPNVGSHTSFHHKIKRLIA